MKNMLLCALFVSAFFSVYAQSDKNVEKGFFKVNALVPGVSYELGVGKNSSFNFDALLIPGGGSRYDEDVQFGLFPGLQAEFRYFTNFDRRIAKGKNISGNSGNYVGAVNQFYLGDPILGNYVMGSSFYNVVGLTYGIQRTRPKGFYWNASFGPGIAIDDFDPDPILFVDLKLGWVIGKKQ